MTQIVAIDIGGTHARFALADVAGGRVRQLAPEVTLRTNDHAGLADAWREFARASGGPLPAAAAIAFAGPIQGEILQLTNSAWTLRPARVAEELKIGRLTLVNDFGAVAHAVAQAPPEAFQHLCGPDIPLPAKGVIGIVGPGTGLGVAQLLRRDGRYFAIATEGGHIGFAPLDPLEDAIVAHLRPQHRRVSVERIVSGPGLANIHAALAAIEHGPVPSRDHAQLWADALAGTDRLAAAAVDRFCLALGSVAGDIALAQGASGMVIAGGVGQRLRAHLPRSGFGGRFVAKGRFERMMAAIPVKLITHPQPGLYGAAAAFAQEWEAD